MNKSQYSDAKEENKKDQNNDLIYVIVEYEYGPYLLGQIRIHEYYFKHEEALKYLPQDYTIFDGKYTVHTKYQILTKDEYKKLPNVTDDMIYR